MSNNQKPIIGISMGDFNGIGPEIIIKALEGGKLNKMCTPIIYGSGKLMSRYRQLIGTKDFQFFTIQKTEQANHKQINLINCTKDNNYELELGKVTENAGIAAYDSLRRAMDDLKANRIDALVTAPINKHNIQNEKFKFPGHTEFLAESCQTKDYLMLMVSEVMKVAVVTGHVPVEKVKDHITKDLIIKKLQVLIKSLKQDFGISKPKIAVLGLNPHAGENGLLGNEEIDIINPAIIEMKKKGNLIFGPFPSDGFFATNSWKQYDAILAMYHDQGLIPFKMMAFESGVNFTAGLPIVRTSPDHGTAYDIAGKNIADESSFIHAIYQAIDISIKRAESIELSKNSIKGKQLIAMAAKEGLED